MAAGKTSKNAGLNLSQIKATDPNNILSGFNFTAKENKTETKEEKTEKKQPSAEANDEKRTENVIKQPKAEKKSVEVKPKEKKEPAEKKEKQITSESIQKQTQEAEEEQLHISAMISEKADKKAKEWMSIYGYKKFTPFVVAFLENLDLYLTEKDHETGKIARKGTGTKKLGLQVQNENSKPIKISVMLSAAATGQMKKWMEKFGEKKVSSFVSYLLENLDSCLEKP